MSDRGRAGTFRAALAHRDYRFLLASLAISETGNWLYAAASIIYILDATGSASWIGVAAVVRLLPYILFGPLGGAIADRFDRRTVMIVSDLARACLMVVLTVVATSDSTAAVIGAIAIAFVNNSFSAPYYPAVTAITPSVVTCVMVVNFIARFLSLAPPLVGGLTPTTNSIAPIRHPPGFL